MPRAYPLWLIIIILVLTSGPLAEDAAAASAPNPAAPRTAKNVIVLIPDGCSSEQYTLARWFKGAPLALDRILVGAVKTHVADSVVADSAPAASAFATGHRTSCTFISLGPQNPPLACVPRPDPRQSYKPLATVLEGAKLLGKATGLVVTSRISHATPAAFYAHVPSRRQENDIAEQGVYQNLDVVLGGGRRQLLPHEDGGRRTDRENLVEVLQQRGYAFVTTAEELHKVKTGQVYGIFAPNNLEAEIDRPEFAPRQPTLEDMTQKALELLSQDPEGFFLLVEGSQVDWAGHAHDPAHLLSDLLMFDRAVNAALDFARQDGNTLVLAASDHNTGGLTIGNYATSDYPRMTPEALLAPLKKMRLSARGLWRKAGPLPTPEKIQAVVREFWGLEITPEEAQRILARAPFRPGDPNYGFGEVICPKYTYIGWSTHGHTGGDVPLFAFGPGRPAGLLEGPEIGRVCARALGVNLDRLNARLFQDAAAALPGGQVSLDVADPENPVVKITCRGRQAELPVNKNLLRLEGKTVPLEGVVVYVPQTKKIFLPLQAVNLITGAPDPLPPVTE